MLHTTVVRWLALALQRSVETSSIDPDGKSFRVRGGMIGTGSVDDTGTQAEYDLRWRGVAIRQRTTRV